MLIWNFRFWLWNLGFFGWLWVLGFVVYFDFVSLLGWVAFILDFGRIDGFLSLLFCFRVFFF